MSSHLTSTDELDGLMRNSDDILVLHALDGEIWGASRAATDLLGYSEDEIRQIYLANIKPKKLRLSDVCKTQKDQNAAIVFEKRNGRRFSAKVETTIISSFLGKEEFDLVLLKLEMVDASLSSPQKEQRLDPDELSQFISSLSQDMLAPLDSVKARLNELEFENLEVSRAQLVSEVSKLKEDLTFINNNIVDCLRLGLGSIDLDRQPFNVIDHLGNAIQEVYRFVNSCSCSVANNIPELIYGDEQRTSQIINTIFRSCLPIFKAERCSISIDRDEDSKKADSIEFVLDFHGCASLKPQNQEQHRLIQQFIDHSVALTLSKNLIRLMNGSFTSKVSAEKVSITVKLEFPEVHNLGLTGDRCFLQDQECILLEKVDSCLSTQLEYWGANVKRFKNYEDTASYLQTYHRSTLLFIIHELEIEPNILDSILQYVGSQDKIIVIKENFNEQDLSSRVLRVASPYQPAYLGNTLSQLVQKPFPFPYSNTHKIRAVKKHETRKRILLVDGNLNSKVQIAEQFESQDFAVETAVNGIDAVLAAAHTAYDLIIMDIHMPYMDGIEAIVHLRKVSTLNAQTPSLLLSNEDSANTTLAAQKAGINTLLKRPVSNERLIAVSQSLISGNRENVHAPEGGSDIPHRRSSEGMEDASDHNAIDEEVLNRLAEDTSSDLCGEMVSIFLDETAESIDTLSSICEQGDWPSISNVAHELKSASRTFGCEALHKLASQIEAESANGNEASCEKLIKDLPKVFNQSKASLTSYCSR